ncbi:4-alpha-glucanotransferase [Rubripirellula obstinata]|uniref:4-alpha-glucanotransferase n=1 Tax=Rubripirellula obstinata TaxID=406547 RepID=A0A5B1CF56_9BACT|nr:4-alpha-glucanotransferase [Rubripirellula obstinata]KAA1258851.1 4-alpha-glucanotransferase [Rubripirellula obstinata]
MSGLLGRRSSGVLCHVTSLSSEHGVGDLGPTSRRFVDFLVDAGQTIWQMLPLCPPARNDSPYSCYSAMAGNPVMISPDRLVSDGLISAEELSSFAGELAMGDDANFVDFDRVIRGKASLLKLAHNRFKQSPPAGLTHQFESFKTSSADWLDDFARYDALMRKHDQIDWSFWPKEIALRDIAAMQRTDEELAEQIEHAKFVQFIFDHQWMSLRKYANDRGVLLCGDMPIFVAHESADVWANQSLFSLDETGRPSLVAGVPPDYFSKTGQLWGNPQYDWNALEATDYQWWTDRFARTLQQFDMLRVDHFRAFEAYWEIPATAETAVDGKWVTGPGEAPFRAAEDKLGEMLIIAEDLGLITDAVYELRDALGFPGMRVMQFGYGSADDDYHRPSAYPPHCVAYTGTHDNDTVIGWYESQINDDGFRELISDVVVSEDNIHLQLIKSVLGSAADTTIIPIQDLLGLGNEAKMNTPGEAKGNWAWCLAPDQLTATHAVQLKWITEETDRLAYVEI